MSILQIAGKRIGAGHSHQVKAVSSSSVLEMVWALFAFALFLVLGPFAAVAVIPSLVHLIPKDSEPEPETLMKS